jgi:hypothetical protein
LLQLVNRPLQRLDLPLVVNFFFVHTANLAIDLSKLTVQFLDYQVFASYAFCMLRDHCVIASADLFGYQFAALDLFGQICDFVVRLLLFIQKLPLSYF